VICDLCRIAEKVVFLQRINYGVTTPNLTIIIHDAEKFMPLDFEIPGLESQLLKIKKNIGKIYSPSSKFAERTKVIKNSESHVIARSELW